MPKSSSTVHLEESTWKEISEYQKANGGITRNDAIERMFTERRLLLKLNKLNKQDKSLDNKNIDNKNIDNDKVNDVVKSVYADMPD